MSQSNADPFARAAADAAALRARAEVDRVEAVVVLGSGLGAFADALDEPRAVPMVDLAGFAPPTVAGHAGRAVVGRVGGSPVLVLAGRTHLYEGRTVADVCHGVRVGAALGAHTAVLTNAAGAIRADLAVGSLVAIADHLNLSGANPLTALDGAGARSSFVDLSAAYDPGLRGAAAAIDPGLAEAVYAALPGPSYETPAEIRMLAAMGADLVGMSTANETIAARHLGLRVAGFSLVTNRAAGLGGPLSHAEVEAAARAAAAGTVAFLGAFVPVACHREPT